VSERTADSCVSKKRMMIFPFSLFGVEKKLCAVPWLAAYEFLSSWNHT